ncbi:MAG: EutN/CcmL family microcompartment protein [Ignavibacteriaceae bacterium]
MILGKVIGTIWSTKKDENLVGSKMLIVRELDLELKEKSDFLIAVDSVGAGEGEIVLVVTGSAARQTEITKNKPVDAVVMAIVDDLNVAEKLLLKQEG